MTNLFEFDKSSARRMPVYLLLDTSGSMSGDPISAVEQGVQMLINELLNDPASEELVWLSIITFDSKAKQLIPLTEIGKVNPPSLVASGSTSMGEAFRILSNALDMEIKERTQDQKGDYKPLVFLLTDGEPTDDFQAGLGELKARQSKKPANIIALGCGSQVNTQILQQITSNVMLLDNVNTETLKSFFKWVSASVQTSSRGVGTPGAAAQPAVQLPPAPEGFTVVL